jgi:predicted XRE-type DNA-binding protein
MTDRKVGIEEGSGNVFADLGLPEADDLLLKSQIVIELHGLMRERRLTQTETAKLMGIAQPDLSNLLRGELRGYSVERLIRMLTAFGRDVEIVVKPPAAKAKTGRVLFKSDEVRPRNVQRKPVSSSALVSIGYAPSTKTLEVEFRDGTYRYFDVPEPTYRALENAPSKSTFFSTQIRDRFNFEPVPDAKSGRGVKGARANTGSSPLIHRARSAARR